MSGRRIPSVALWELAAQRLASGRPFELRARGDSMRPTIPDGALVTLAPLGTRGVRVGDVVLLQVGEGAVIHRVVARWGGLVWTKGDLNPWREPPMPEASVVGRVIAVRQGDRTARDEGLGAAVLRAALTAAAWMPRRRRRTPGFV